MKAKTYEKTNPKQERIVNIRNLSDKFSILIRKSGAETFQNHVFIRVPPGSKMALAGI